MSEPSLWFAVQRQDRQRIRCKEGWETTCGKPAWFSEHVHWNSGNTRGMSFFYYCRTHGLIRIQEQFGLLERAA